MTKEKRKKKKMSKAKLIRIIITIVVILAGLSGLVLFLRKKVSEKYASKNESEIISAQVESGSISTTVYGSGQLSDDDVEEISIPDSVEIDELKASPGDAVEEGDVLATVKMQSVITAMSEVQTQIDELDDQLEDAEDDEVESTIKANVSGRVKDIYASEGDAVMSVMAENNALMTISADGYMAVDITGSSLNEGAEVTVTASDDTEFSGTVKYVSGETAIVLFSDEALAAGDKVAVKDSDGNEIGSGQCYINSPVTVVGYGGTISSINVSENSSVSSGSSLISLTDTEYTVNFETLLKQRSKLEETLSDLLEIYKKGAITASISGSIKSVPDTEESSSTDNTDTDTDNSKVYTISPDKTMTVSVSVDETDILSLETGQEADITISSLGDDTYTGTITEINKTGTGSDGVTTYTASIQIEKQDGMLEGMSAEASIKIKSVDNTLMVAADAVNITSSSAYVYTTYDEEKDELGGLTEVTVGISNSSNIEIVSGLSEGDTVYYKEKTDSRNPFGGSFGGFGDSKMDFGNSNSMPGGSGNPFSGQGNPTSGDMPSFPGSK